MKNLNIYSNIIFVDASLPLEERVSWDLEQDPYDLECLSDAGDDS